jgi:hypothetical protein
MTRKILYIVALLFSQINLTAQEQSISSFVVEQSTPWVPDTVQNAPTPTTSILKVVVSFNQLPSNALIHLECGSQSNLTDGLQQVYSIAFFKNKFRIKNSIGEYCASFTGNTTTFYFQPANSDLVKYKYWKIWLEFPDNSTSNTFSFILP